MYRFMILHLNYTYDVAYHAMMHYVHPKGPTWVRQSPSSGGCGTAVPTSGELLY